MNVIYTIMQFALGFGLGLYFFGPWPFRSSTSHQARVWKKRG